MKFSEEKMLHEEIHLNWDDIQNWIEDHRLMEALKNDLIIGVGSKRFNISYFPIDGVNFGLQ